MNAPRRILLVDDTPEIAELLTFALRDRGYGVISTGFTATVNAVSYTHLTLPTIYSV